MDLEKAITLAIVANLCALNFRIIWNWLSMKNRPEEKAAPTTHLASQCVMHQLLERRQEEMAALTNNLKQVMAAHTAVADQKFLELRTDMDRGQAVFDKITDSLSALQQGQASINATIASAFGDISRRLTQLENGRHGSGR